MIKRRLFKLSVLAFAFAFTASAPARTVNTASMIATVVDQNGAVVKGAHVSVVNTATGATREALSGDEGTATMAGLALTGGGSQLTGIAKAARDQLGMSARIQSPSGLGGLTDQIATPRYAASSGLLLWGARNWPAEEDGSSARSLEGVTSRIGKIFKGLMP